MSVDSREQAIAAVRELGVGGPDLYLLDLVPVVEMIWADGQRQRAEVILLDRFIPAHVKRVNAAVGREVVTVEQATDFAYRLLEERPDPRMLEALRRLLPDVRFAGLDEDDRRESVEAVLQACLSIGAAAVTKYPYDHEDRFSEDERRLFLDLMRDLQG